MRVVQRMKLMEKMECVNGESANEKPKPVGSYGGRSGEEKLLNDPLALYQFNQKERRATNSRLPCDKSSGGDHAVHIKLPNEQLNWVL